MVINRSRAGRAGESMSCDGGTRAARERAMIKLAARPDCIGYAVKRKLKGDFTLSNVSRALDLAEFQAWSLMLADRPTRTLERRQLEDGAGLEHGSLDEWLS